MTQSFKGIFAPLTTPFIDENISSQHLKDNIRRYNAFDLSGYVVLGSTGESIYLSDEESLQIVKGAREAASPGKIIIAGTGRESTKGTMEFTRMAADSGADAALVRPPSYFKSRLSEKALLRHFKKIADSVDIPIMIYNIPVHTGYALSAPLITELSSHPNIQGLKDSSGDLSSVGEILAQNPADFDVLLGAASIYLPGLVMGISGAIITLSDIVPGLCIKLQSLFQEKRWEEARKLQLDLIPLNKALIQTYGVAAVKYALDRIGFYGGPCRAPLLPLEGSDKDRMDALLRKLGLL